MIDHKTKYNSIRTREQLKAVVHDEAKHKSDRRYAALELTARSYREQTRAIVGINCVYHSTSRFNEGCAIGQLLPPGFSRIQLRGGIRRCFTQLPHSIRSLGEEFLSHLQEMHDDHRMWNTEGISKFGERYADKAIKTFRLGAAMKRALDLELPSGDSLAANPEELVLTANTEANKATSSRQNRQEVTA